MTEFEYLHTGTNLLDQTSLGITYSTIAYPLMYLLSWSSVVAFAIYQYRRSNIDA